MLATPRRVVDFCRYGEKEDGKKILSHYLFFLPDLNVSDFRDCDYCDHLAVLAEDACIEVAKVEYFLS